MLLDMFVGIMLTSLVNKNSNTFAPDELDWITDLCVSDGKPTGSIRISFGHYSSIKDADFVIQLIKDHFVNNKPTKGT